MVTVSSENIARMIVPTANQYVRLSLAIPIEVTMYRIYGVDLKWGYCSDSKTMYYLCSENEYSINLNTFTNSK